MKKFLILSFGFLLSLSVMAQKSSISFAGGAFVATNNSTTFVGFIGPKLTVVISVTNNFKTEIGFTGMPGLTLKPEVKLGLAIGPTLTFKKENWKIKPMIGCIFIKTTKWQSMFGIGFLF